MTNYLFINGANNAIASVEDGVITSIDSVGEGSAAAYDEQLKNAIKNGCYIYGSLEQLKDDLAVGRAIPIPKS